MTDTPRRGERPRAGPCCRVLCRTFRHFWWTKKIETDLKMNPQNILAASIWHFRHGVGFIGELTQIVAGLLLWALFGYVPLKILLMSYESGKGDEQRREIERAEDDRFPSRMGWYRTAFCLHISVSLASILEGLRFGGG
jgi:hypothetical protein